VSKHDFESSERDMVRGFGTFAGTKVQELWQKAKELNLIN